MKTLSGVAQFKNQGPWKIPRKAQPKIGYVPIEHFKTDRPKVCEAPRHQGLVFPLPAFAVVAVIDEHGNEIVQMVCHGCWKHFDDDLGNPNWNMLEWEGER